MSKRIVLLTLMLTTVSAIAAQLKIGWATADASTDKPVYMVGLDRRRNSHGLRDPITTTALVIDNGEGCVIFNSWDTCVINPRCATRIRAEVAKRIPGFPTEKIIFNAIHTHTGPALAEWYRDPLTNWYREMFIDKTAAPATTSAGGASASVRRSRRTCGAAPPKRRRSVRVFTTS